ncbi:MAG: V-type ATP synthase subunit D [Firmicutes bacterium]|jgi:V/A-type H+-transporting ATPase subunit D|nr:V-type ATP synthase subunit D [Bacillota bacterium]
MEIKASPNRMQLLMLKRRLTMARRGHKLLKDKRDELMRRFMELIDRNRELRDEVFAQLNQVYQGFLVARGVMSPQMLEEAIMFPKERLALSAREENIMSVRVPRFEWQKEGEVGDIYPYGYAHTSAELDRAIEALSEVLPKMIELAALEKSAELMAEEIEKTRRRVNALEHVLIPRLEETIKFITMKLDETERATLTRLMKIKDMLQARGV